MKNNIPSIKDLILEKLRARVKLDLITMYYEKLSDENKSNPKIIDFIQHIEKTYSNADKLIQIIIEVKEAFLEGEELTEEDKLEINQTKEQIMTNLQVFCKSLDMSITILKSMI